MKYYLIAGEASGDLHGSNLMKELKKQDKAAVFRCWGGDLMQLQGGEIIKHYRDLAFMGFAEVLLNLRTILKNIEFCKKDILAYKPDVLVLIDYPGFNLRIAEFAHKHGIKVFYYISPQIWAWKQSRVFKIRQVVDQMAVILPFEEEFYQKFDYKVHYVGHPLLDAIEGKITTDIKEKIVAVLPGSRKQEIRKMLPLMLRMQKYFPEYRFVLAGAPSISKEFYMDLIGEDKVEVVYNQTYSLFQKAQAALVTSGTATLEAALFDVPEVVCYKGSSISYEIAKRLVKIKYISLVNLIMDREIVKELIQHDFNEGSLKAELEKILSDEAVKTKMKNDYLALKEKLGGGGASVRTAELVVELAQK